MAQAQAVLDVLGYNVTQVKQVRGTAVLHGANWANGLPAAVARIAHVPVGAGFARVCNRCCPTIKRIGIHALLAMRCSLQVNVPNLSNPIKNNGPADLDNKNPDLTSVSAIRTVGYAVSLRLKYN
jgi:hypothetical protein